MTRLKLYDTDSVRHVTSAAFIRGNAPKSWLQELNRWGIAIQHLECYLVPESIQSLRPAGLFVVIRAGVALKQVDFMEPYGLLADKLYVPVNAQLYPEVSAEELQSLLLWDCQLFHPTIGLVGFSTTDRLDLSTLLEYAQPKGTNWNLAHPGLPPKAQLRHIQVLQPTAKEVMEAFRESLDRKPLNEIPNKQEDKPSAVSQLMDDAKRGILSTILAVIDKIRSLFSFSEKESSQSGKPTKSQPPSSANQPPHKPGLFERFENWMVDSLEELERKRNNEIKRLLDLFDENTDEALKYAIPLESPYQNRGTAPPSAQLTRRSTNFSLGSLGGGGRVDSWNVDHYYGDLRTKYLRAAQKEIEAKDFKKAAYVYAHLLGDYHSAAKVLEQGEHYREAAALHKDHLNNIPAAAACLERGGLLLEAVELYIQLDKNEKVGDLYKQMEQTESAELYYEKSIDIVLANKDYLDASRMMRDKLEKPDRAKKTLLYGWQESNQSEPCLKGYFDLVAATEEERLSQRVEEIYAQHTPANKKTQFLNTLVYLNDKSPNADLLDTSRGLAYEIISEQTEAGNRTNLPMLQKFLAKDRLIASDCSRFSSNFPKPQLKQSAGEPLYQLDKRIKWLNAIVHRNQYLALGIKDNCLHLARGNWYQNFEYYSWPDQVDKNEVFSLVAEPYGINNHIIIHSSGESVLNEKRLPKNKYFDEQLNLTSPHWLAGELMGIVIKPEKVLSLLKANRYAMTLHHYNLESASLLRSVPCKFEEERQLLMNLPSGLSELIYKNDFYYTYHGNFFMKISEDGVVKRLNVGASIQKMASYSYGIDLTIVLSTDKGCLLIKPQTAGLAGLYIGDIRGRFFATDVEVIALKLLPLNCLIIASQDKAVVYHIVGDTVTAGQEFTSQSPIIAILPTSKRHQFALLEETGDMTMCDIEAE